MKDNQIKRFVNSLVSTHTRIGVTGFFIKFSYNPPSFDFSYSSTQRTPHKWVSKQILHQNSGIKGKSPRLCVSTCSVENNP